MIEIARDGIDKELQYIQKKVEDDLKESSLEMEYGKIKVNRISDNIFSVTTLINGNIQYYINNNNIIIINPAQLTNIDRYIKYSNILGVEETKNENGEYEMFTIQEGGKRTKLDKYSLEYLEVWQNISFLQGRDLILHTYKGDAKNTVIKVKDEYIERMVNEKVIRLVDLVVFLQKGNITKEQFEKYITQLNAPLLEQIGDSRFGLLDNNFKFHITHEGNRYEINTGKVNEDEINYLFKAGLISQELHKLAMEKYHELEKLEKEKKGEIKKPLDNLKEEIKGIAN